MRAPVNRRHFLKVSASTGVVACTSVATSRQQTSPNQRLVAGVMGVNGRGRSLAVGFARQENVEIRYVCDVDSRALAPAAGAVSKVQQKAPVGVADFRRMLDDRELDILIVATPNHWHAPATIMACNANKHVYVEKPCSFTAEEGEGAVAAARKHNCVVTMGTQRRSRAPIIQGIEKLRQGAIGTVRYARCWYANNRGTIGRGKEMPVPEWLDFDLWQGPAPRRPYKDNLVHYNWHWHWHWGNGELGNNGVHALDLARWGMDVSYPTYVTSAGGRYRFDDDQETPDTHTVTFEFGDRAIHWEGLSCNRYGPDGSTFGLTFHGDQGTMRMFDSGYRIFDRQAKQVDEFSGPGSDAEHFANFLDCIRSGGRPTADIEEAHKSTLLCHLGNIAQRARRSLQIDSVTGHILRDEQAARMWGREYAPGWTPQV